MAFGFPPQCKEQRQFDGYRGDLVGAVRGALDDIGWAHEIVEDTPQSVRIEAVSPWSLVGRGEHVTIEVRPPERRVVVRSRCKEVTKIFDWGRNRYNVERFFERLRSHVR